VTASTTVGRRSARFFAPALVLLVAAGAVQALWARFADPLPGAWWIGFWDKARAGLPAEVAFGTRFRLEKPASAGRLRLRAVGDGTVLLDGEAIAAGTGSADIVVPLAAGDHALVVLLRHPEGLASLKLRLETPEKVVVTGPLWRVDDDLERMGRRGFGGARYPATLWARSFVSSLDSSSSTRSWRGSAAETSAPSSSRMPSRAATE
jgi:hypothetical protein